MRVLLALVVVVVAGACRATTLTMYDGGWFFGKPGVGMLSFDKWEIEDAADGARAFVTIAHPNGNRTFEFGTFALYMSFASAADGTMTFYSINPFERFSLSANRSRGVSFKNMGDVLWGRSTAVSVICDRNYGKHSPDGHCSLLPEK